MSECGGLTDEQQTRIIVLSVICVVLTCCFAVWVIACCCILFKKGERDIVFRKTREERMGSQAVTLIKTGQTLVDNRKSIVFDSPTKTETFGYKKGKEIANLLKETEFEDKLSVPTFTNVNIEQSITFNTFVKSRPSQDKTMTPIADENGSKAVPNPNYESSVDILNDEDSLPLVQDTPIRRSSKGDLAKRLPSGSGANTVEEKEEGTRI